MHHALGPAVPLGRLLERAHDHVRALGVVDAVADDVAGAVVDEDQREGRDLPDVPLHEVQVPEVIRPHGLVAAIVLLPLDLRRPIPRVLHHAAGRVHRDLDPLAPKLVDDLARPQPGVRLVLAEDLGVALLLDVLGAGPLVGDGPSPAAAFFTRRCQS